MSKLMLADWDTDWRVLSSGFRRCPNRGVSEACFMGVVCPEGIRALERNSYEAEEMVEPDGRDGGRHGDPVDRRRRRRHRVGRRHRRARLTASKTVTATDKPNVFDVNLSATGRDYAKNKEHALFVLDRTGSVGQSEYDEIANMVRGLGRRLMATGQVQVSVVLFAGGAQEENSVWYDGYENMVTHSTNPADLDRIMVPVSTTTTTTHNGVFYGSEYGTNWEAAFDGASNVMAHEQLPTDVFFFSDGHPNTWAGADGYKEEEAYSHALSRAREFAASYGDHIQNFTSIGLQRDNQDLSKLEHLSKDVFGAKATTEFASTGDQISEDLESNVENELMTGGFAKGVTLTDQLSGNVKPVSTDTKGRPGLSVGVSTDGGKATTLVEGKDYEYTYANNRISVRLLNQLKAPRPSRSRSPSNPLTRSSSRPSPDSPAPTRETRTPAACPPASTAGIPTPEPTPSPTPAQTLARPAQAPCPSPSSPSRSPDSNTTRMPRPRPAIWARTR